MHIRNPIVIAHPLVSMVIRPHAVIQHRSPFLYQLSQLPARPIVFGILADIVHGQYDLFAHYRTLDGSVSMIE